jgi:pimeloyl-ACP methyl ester carboxylesterase
MSRRVLGRIFKWLGLLVLAVVLAGAAYQQIGTMADARAVPPPGRMVAVDGLQIHVHCIGAGKRTFVLDAGGQWSTHWYRIQPELANSGRVCAFDRPGLGWSESGGRAFDGRAAAAELSRIVAATQIGTPFVYVGHSLGANFAEIYAAEHPGDVEALILIDPGNPKDMLEDFHGTREEAMALPACGWRCIAGSIVGRLGVMRIASRTAGASFADLAVAQYRAGVARSSSVGTMMAFFDAVPKTAFQCLEIKSFGSLPVLTLASSELRDPEGKETLRDVTAWRQGYLKMLAEMTAKSGRGSGPIVIPGSTHKSIVLGEKPAAEVVRAIEAFLGSTKSS